MDLNEFLFKTSFKQSKGGKIVEKPLFRFQSEIASEIIANVPHYQSKSEDSIRVYLNQVLKSKGEKFKKPISDELKHALSVVVKLKVDKSDSRYGEIGQLLNSAYEIDVETKIVTESFETRDYEHFKQWQSKSNRTIVIDRMPVEVSWYRLYKQGSSVDLSDTEDVIKLMIDNVLKNFSEEPDRKKSILFDRDIAQKELERNDQYQYQFFVPSLSVAREFWEALYVFILNYVGFTKDEIRFQKRVRIMKSLAKFLRRINGGMISDQRTKPLNTFLKVFVTDPTLTLASLVYYESSDGFEVADKNGNIKMEKEALFQVAVSDSGTIQTVVKRDKYGLRFFKDHVYYPIMYSEKTSFNIQEIKFENMEPHILRTFFNQA